MVSVADLDVDIWIEDAPNMVELEGEQFEHVVGLAQAGVIFPPQVYIELAPNIRNKDKLLEAIQQQQAAAAQAPNPELEMEAAKTKADVEKKQAETQKTQVETAAMYARGAMGVL